MRKLRRPELPSSGSANRVSEGRAPSVPVGCVWSRVHAPWAQHRRTPRGAGAFLEGVPSLQEVGDGDWGLVLGGVGGNKARPSREASGAPLSSLGVPVPSTREEQGGRWMWIYSPKEMSGRGKALTSRPASHLPEPGQSTKLSATPSPTHRGGDLRPSSSSTWLPPRASPSASGQRAVSAPHPA